jgi:ComF family protein
MPEPLRAEFFCISCRTPFVNDFPLDSEGRCGLCRSGLRGFDAAYSYGAYEGPLREMIHLLKYRQMRGLAGPLGKFLLDALPRDEAFDAVVPVPLHWRREWDRGFNQAELLAGVLAQSAGLPCIRSLRRVKSTAAQAGLSNSGRRRNVTQAFRCHRPASVEGKRILLVDDVMTTGSTAAACALALKRAGAKRVALLTVARADRRLAGRRRAAVISTVGRTVRNGE